MQKSILPDTETALPARHHKSGRFSPGTVLLLALVLLVGGYFRFVGMNWDDFADLHPDERFLTRNLLPLVGGGLEFTDDQKEFPNQSVLVSPSAPFISRFEVQQSRDYRAGGLKDTPGYETARWWLGANRVIAYETPQAALNGLLNGEIAALVVDDVTAETLSSSARTLEKITSTEIQRMRCQALNPETGGAGGFFDTACSPLNPHNAGAGFYAYGTLPLFIAHFVSQFIQQQDAAGSSLFNFQGGTLVWRFFSAVFDCGTILLIFFIGARQHSWRTGLLAAVLYAAAPLAIQKSHFGTVNAITTFFVALALWAAVGVQDKGHRIYYVVFGFGLGAALAGRINTLPLAGVVVLAAMVYAFPVLDGRLPWSERQRILTQAVTGVFLGGLVTVVTFRICNPYAFRGPGFFGIIPDARFLADLASATFGVSGYSDAPPNYQWMNRASYLFPLKDMLLWGMGIASAAMAWFGWAWSGYRLLRAKPYATRNILLFAWVLVYFGYMGNQWVMTMRYYLPLYPALALLAGWAVVELARQATLHERDIGLTRILLVGFAVTLGAIPVYYLTNTGGLTSTATTAGIVAMLLLAAAFVPGLRRGRAAALGSFVVLFSLVWGLMFTHLYRTQVTRVQASRWVWENIPGDFAMRITGAPEGTPLVNIAVPNSPVGEGVSRPDLLEMNASRLQISQPFLTEFTAPADGVIDAVYAPHLGDADDDPDPEMLYLSIARSGDSVPLGVANLTANLTRDTHILGAAYSIPLDTPVEVKAGEKYTFKVEALSGNILSGGSVVVTEGDWDDRITSTHICRLPEGLSLKDNLPSGYVGYDECNGIESWFALVSSYDQAMSYPVDDLLKRDSIINSLNVGDYITITSNRFYDTEWRNRLRWPLTSYYYDALFRGELGYELVAVFDESFEFGPLSVSDQHLPIYDSPVWMNEWEADEAFHVYDHPAVFVFRKRPDYDAGRITFQLNSIAIRQIGQIVSDFTAVGAQFVGVVYWSSIDADNAPTGLMLPPDMRDIQQKGGTWSERFNSGSILNTSQPVGVAVWWLALVVFGWITFPILFTAFPGLADRGYGFAKIVGLFIVAYLAWLAASVKIPLWSQGGVMLVMGMVGVFSGYLAWKRRDELRDYLRETWQRLAWIEVITLVLLLAFIFVRLTNPDLWHDSKGGEKPMDFSMFNAILRSTVFPPYDAWYSGGFINYYYFGYVLVGSPVLLLQIVPAFAYNLIVPTLFALTGIGAFSAAFNLVHSWRERPPASLFGAEARPRTLGTPWMAGIVALLLCVVLGNLDTIRVLGTGLATLGGYQTPQGMEDWYIRNYQAQTGLEATPELRAEFRLRAANASLFEHISYEVDNSLALVSGIFNGLSKAAGGATLPIGSDRWYWGPSRVIAEAPGVGGNAITEMPYFTFLYADLHAHMINLPVLLFVLMFVFNEVVLAGSDRRTPLAMFLAIVLGAMVVGMIEAINTWDWPSFLLFSVIGLSYAWWLSWRETLRFPLWSEMRSWLFWFAPLLLMAVVRLLRLLLESIYPTLTGSAVPEAFGIIFTALSILLLLPPLIALASLLVAILNRRALLALVATVGGFVVFSFVSSYPYSVWYAATYGSLQPWTEAKTPLWAYFDIHGTFLFLIVSLLVWETARWLRSVKVKALRGKGSWLLAALIVVGVIGLLALIGALANYQVALVVVPLIAWIVPLFFRRGQSRAMQFVLVLAGFALALTLAVEIVVLSGDIGRQNTVFKFYMQVWLLFSVAGGVAFAWLTQGSDYWSNKLRFAWYIPLLLLFFIAGMFPIMATRARALDRMAPDMPPTLNGMDYMQYAQHALMDYGDVISLKADYEIIRWLQENVKGSPVIIEGRSLASEYRWNTRITIYTGLPSVLGWNFHERQQRTFDPLPRLVEQREANIKYFYNTASIVDAVRILRQYGVTYVIVSDMERIMTTPEGIAKFDSMVRLGLLKVVFDQEGGLIYETVPAALTEYAYEHRGEGEP